MVKLPEIPLHERINEKIEAGAKEEYPRHYIGYSELGGPCARQVWYSFRWAKLRSTIPRMIRLYSRGDWEEERLEADLAKIGISIKEQQKEIVGLAGHVLGHIDGVLYGDWFDDEVLAEFKTANQKNFDKIKKEGVQKATPKYYSQAQSYMGKLELRQCLFIVTNKNTEHRWMTIIDFDEEEFERLEQRAMSILVTDIPPERIGNSTWYECKYCDYHQICHFNDKILKSCRTCEKGTIEENGIWRCGLTGKELNVQEQRKGCDKYILLKDIKR